MAGVDCRCTMRTMILVCRWPIVDGFVDLMLLSLLCIAVLSEDVRPGQVDEPGRPRVCMMRCRGAAGVHQLLLPWR